jgi:serine protease Do
MRQAAPSGGLLSFQQGRSMPIARTLLLATLTVALLSPPMLASAQSAAAARGLPDFSDLVEQVGPAVVNIRTTERAKPGAEAAGLGDDEARELFRRFFGVPPPTPTPRRNAPPAEPDEPVQRGVGSGFIVSADGLVFTNAHVVDGADEVFVRLTDKREFKARLIGSDKRSDVAVLKIEADKLPSVRFGDVSRLKVGEWVIAIGSPFNLDNTVTAGIVSAKARDTGDLLPLIQTDVAINPGNSGGPLINLRGEVVGINSQIYSRSGGYMGIAFAIPVDEVQRIATQLRTTGRVVRGRIGVRIGEVSKDVADALGLPKPLGALVRSAETDGPAAQAGIEGGDIITRFEDQSIETWTDLPRFVSNTQPGSQHTLQVWRRGAFKELSVTIVALEPEERTARAEPAKPPVAVAQGRAADLGLKVSDLSDADKRELKLKGGVRVDAAQGAAARAGLRVGDIVVGLSNTDVVSAKGLEVLLAHVDRNKPLSVLFRREDLAQYAVIRPGR